MSKLTTRDVSLVVAVPVAIIFVALVTLAFLSAGCAASKVACQVIRAANDVCTVIEYTGDDGVVHQEPVDPRDLQMLAKSAAARRAAGARDAGSD